jgi:hypothetical protein
MAGEVTVGDKPVLKPGNLVTEVTVLTPVRLKLTSYEPCLLPLALESG